MANMLQRSLDMSIPEVMRGSGAELFVPVETAAANDAVVLFLYIDFTVREHDIRGYIAMLAVSAAYRRHGVATKLVLRAIEAIANRKADEIVLETEETNTPAIRLYERLGFMRSKKLHRYYLNGKSAFRLVLQLRSDPPDDDDDDDWSSFG